MKTLRRVSLHSSPQACRRVNIIWLSGAWAFRRVFGVSKSPRNSACGFCWGAGGLQCRGVGVTVLCYLQYLAIQA